MRTMTTVEFLSHLQSRDIRLWPSGDKLGYSAAGAMTPDLRDELVARKADLLAHLRCSESGTPRPKGPIAIAARNGDMALSFAQVRLWFLEHLDSGNPLNITVRGLRLRGELSVDALQAALCRLVSRHETLRTSFHGIKGVPVQRVAAVAAIALARHDISDYPEDRREARARRLATLEARRAFDLAKPPLVRASLIRFASDDNLLILTAHQIAADGWSMDVLVRDLLALYESERGGAAASLPELPVQYADYATWQRERLKNGLREIQLAYWKRRLDGAPLRVELPSDRPRTRERTYRSARETLVLSEGLAGSLDALSRDEGVELSVILLAVFQTLLFRYTRQADVVVGAGIANRLRAETEPLVGLFANTLVVRTDLSGDPTFRELIGRVRDVALGAFAHAELPVETLVDELQPERSLTHDPLVSVAFEFPNSPEQAPELSSLSVSAYDVHIGASRYDLALSVRMSEGSLACTVEYDRDLFEAPTIRRCLADFERLLERCVSQPADGIGDLTLIADDARHKALDKWSDGGTRESPNRADGEVGEPLADARAFVQCGRSGHNGSQ
jgi:hypothetical protein